MVCGACLKGTARCPSCQRPFAETREEAPRAEASRDARLERGRRQLTAVGVSLVGAVVLVAMLGGITFGQMVAQLVVTGLVLLQVFRGRGWARWVLAVLTGIGAIGNGLEAFRALGTEQPLTLSLPLALVFAWSTGVLVLSQPVQRFVRAQKLRHP